MQFPIGGTLKPSLYLASYSLLRYIHLAKHIPIENALIPMQAIESSFLRHKVCADIRRGSQERGVKRQWGDRKRRFSEILDAMSSAP